jgi:hypothetical protein
MLTLIGPTCRQAIDASEVSSATPTAPLKPPVLARDRWHATPGTFGSSKASMTILWSGESHLWTVETAPISSASAVIGRAAA